MNHRRPLLIALGSAAVMPRSLFAQSKQPVVIGWLNTGSRESHGYLLAVFKEALAVLGWKDGAQIAFEERWVGAQRDMLGVLADQLKARKPAIIVAATLTAVVAAAKSMPSTPPLCRPMAPLQ